MGFMDLIGKLSSNQDKAPTATCGAVIVAAGSATRMLGVDKMMAPLGNNPVILHTLTKFFHAPSISEMVVVTRKDLIEPIKTLCEEQGLTKVIGVVEGGADRTSSVLIGCNELTNKAKLIAIHDGARPLITQKIIEETIQMARETGAAAPAIGVKDTIKVVKQGVIQSTPDREALFAVQTPQVFDADLIRGALYQATKEHVTLTDDCSAVERLDMKVHLSCGSEENLKITTPMDLMLARAILQERAL